MLSRLYSVTIEGIQGLICEVEVDVLRGGFEKSLIVGLPDAAVKESIERVKSAITNTGYNYPDTHSLINLAPADIKKVGPGFDLPIALGMLFSNGEFTSPDIRDYVIVGELALDGRVRPVNGILSMAMSAYNAGFTKMIVPMENAQEAAVVNNLEVFPVGSVSQAVALLERSLELEPAYVDINSIFEDNAKHELDFSDVRGQEMVKRALTIAAAGSHNVMMIGPPGTGKTMLSQRLATILPPLTLAEALETTRIYSSIGKLSPKSPLITSRPVRTPHHTASGPALVGGGSNPRPGELSLAHCGILFLDEFAEFPRNVLEMIRQPLESGSVTISRAKGTITFPASFMLVAAMNPCPCGRKYRDDARCRCSQAQIDRYMSRISGPIVDRIDIHVEVSPVPFEKLASKTNGTTSNQMREVVLNARNAQSHRFAESKTINNSNMTSKQIRKFCKLTDEGSQLLKSAMHELGLSARAHDKVLKVARTIADIENSEQILPHHLAEAIQYRKLDREL